ncbi:similar to Saccharomyces cerevisiae YJL046W AIM22 Putative lipoate-protein ligase, required along with Lip2 and Lip5 for lipoylation of Lat1p and Kgd2p [Maudiozyma saulgeensis]|uniref:Putative lipoate-protein ligase A n=1 Tax=Maudiozyma saulgeensis TaxID=1789683 RepID=A0A1X7R3A9_9SACH|nr:similar to Saccharomyces cerevisiae YJL046W AIM22 Putative lipoate-protein ligase, required along with Lip2 and Lip5 for lipoylation of Lat1p and Kgd2p [Kazachstania saulgeensis]
MLKRCYVLPKLNTFVYRSQRHIQTKAPFDINDTDDQYKELNTMYSDMFSSYPKNSISNGTPTETDSSSECDDLNKEFQDLFQIDNPNLSGQELERNVKSPGRFILKSLSNNPYYNLALEDYVFRNTPVSKNITQDVFPNHRLLFYINNKCAVIGKNQTVWQEVYLSELQKQGYELLRRLSGGGAVIHDLGNVNYSFITSRNEFHSSFFNELILKWLYLFDKTLPITLNKRSDILFDGKKCSGSAFKIAQGKAYHHGTMLVNSNLDNFHGLLKPKDTPGVKWDSPSVDSVRSNISNISLESTDRFVDICIDGFKTDFKGSSPNEIPVFFCNEEETINDEILSTIDTLKSDKWKYFSGPKFDIEFLDKQVLISCEKGMVTKSNVPGLEGTQFKTLWEDEEMHRNIYPNKF